MMVQRLLLAAVAALNCCSRSVAIDSSAPRYLLSRAEPYTVPSDGTVMLHNDLWWIGALTADSKFEEIAAASKYNYTASIGIGINHPPNSVNTAARYFNSWGEQALQQQSPGSSSSGDDERTMTDGTPRARRRVMIGCRSGQAQSRKQPRATQATMNRPFLP
jgi:hypothetical protein